MAGGGRRASCEDSARDSVPYLLSTRKRPALRDIPRRSLRVTGLFAGIGGIELGLHRAGHQTAMMCELDVSARAVLETHFPDVENHRDVCKLRRLPPNAELLAAGFPCQDLSQAGMTAGIDGSRSSLIGEVFRLLEKRRVPWVLLENVPFMLRLGRGRALAVIIGELERLGYRWAYRVVNSLAFGVPQRRERVYLVAALDDDPRRVLFADDVGTLEATLPSRSLAFGFYWTEGTRGLGAAIDSVPTLKGGSTIGIPSPPGVLLPDGRVVTPLIEDAERLQGFGPGWTEPAGRVGRRSHRWKLVGNAVTVPVAQWLGERFAAPGWYDGTWDAQLRPGSPWPRAAWSLGRGRFVASVSAWPVRVQPPHLHDFLAQPRLLSARATSGFWERLRKSSLRRPRWFDEGIRMHLRKMQHVEVLRSRAGSVDGDRNDQRAEVGGKSGAVLAHG
jgi:DNA (cytosine-5)-methyltransferase 1